MLKYIILDVDGTLTDGGVYYDEHDNELKKFCTKDGTGIICARTAGIIIIVLTGRKCAATTRRLTELGVTQLHQNIKNKFEWMKNWMRDNDVRKSDVGYIGDDINDLGSMKLCGFVGCPSDAAVEVKEIANYVSSIRGGTGAVRDVIEWYLRKEGIWKEIVNNTYGTGI